jgi:hypothetical protein
LTIKLHSVILVMEGAYMECIECKKESTPEYCQDCCDHNDFCEDKRICLICDKDLTEDMAGWAESAYDSLTDR